MESRGGLGKSALDKKPLGELYGNKDVPLVQLIYLGNVKESKDQF